MTENVESQVEAMMTVWTANDDDDSLHLVHVRLAGTCNVEEEVRYIGQNQPPA